MVTGTETTPEGICSRQIDTSGMDWYEMAMSVNVIFSPIFQARVRQNGLDWNYFGQRFELERFPL